jgi:hypothetical protein
MTNNQTGAYGNLVARAWSDPAFTAQLLADPITALNAMNASMPSGVRVKVVENTEDLVHIVLPPHPADVDLISDESLEKVNGGAWKPTILTQCGC